RTMLVDLPFTFGEQFYLKGVFSVDASFFLNAPSGVPLGGTSIADFAHTITLGPASVLDASGKVVAGATIVSDIDHLAGVGTAPVPEPPEFALLAAGFAFGLSVMRRRSRIRR
ncbi:MAG: PEP-CTERM sorting domain-containing protein, partial [Caldimonas sp.]